MAEGYWLFLSCANFSFIGPYYTHQVLTLSLCMWFLFCYLALRCINWFSSFVDLLYSNVDLGYVSLHFSFGTSERQWVEAQVENAKQQAILMVLKSQVTSDEAHIHLDLHSLRYSFKGHLIVL